MSHPYLLEPLTAPECDLRDFAFMPLEVRRLLTSETWIEAADDPRLGHALMCLWCEAWHQVPAGSLPNKDAVLARYAMCDRQEWERIKERALQGWQGCSDGRLYHPVIAEKANEAWTEKMAFRERRAAFSEKQRRKALARWSNRDSANGNAGNHATAMPRHPSGNAAPMPMKETGTERGTGSHPKAADVSVDALDEDRFWSQVKRLEAKGIRRSQCDRLLKLTGHDFGEANRVLDSTEAAKKPTQYLRAVICDREQKTSAFPAGANPHVPVWVNEKRAVGIAVDREGKHWRCQGYLFTDAGDEVGF
jgi:hypothetical protein